MFFKGSKMSNYTIQTSNSLNVDCLQHLTVYCTVSILRAHTHTHTVFLPGGPSFRTDKTMYSRY